MKPKQYSWQVWRNGGDIKVLLSALDPALLVYQRQHWQTGQQHFVSRIRALALHRATIRKHNQLIAMSNNVRALVYQCFPWNHEYKTIGELRDLRQFVLEELIRVHDVTETKKADCVSLQPRNLTCRYVENVSVLAAWKDLLCACVEEAANSKFDVQVATWETPVLLENSQSLVVSVSSNAVAEDHNLPLVWDENSWAKQLYREDSWPDLQRCVEYYFSADFEMQRYPRVTVNPIPFEWTDSFWKSVEDLCQPQMRRLLVKAIAKRVYGILDSSLGDERLGPIRRFRVTRFWRVHYRQLTNRIVLEEFGEHDMGL